jgi:DNA-damage-inducible protein J
MITKTEKLQARIAPDLKVEVEAILKKLGMSTTEAVTMFFRQIVMNKGMPFDVRIPNSETQKILKDIRVRKGLTKTSMVELRKEFE